MQALNGVKYEIQAQGRTGMGRLVGCFKQKATRSTRRRPAVPAVSSSSRGPSRAGGSALCRLRSAPLRSVLWVPTGAGLRGAAAALPFGSYRKRTELCHFWGGRGNEHFQGPAAGLVWARAPSRARPRERDLVLTQLSREIKWNNKIAGLHLLLIITQYRTASSREGEIVLEKIKTVMWWC